MGNDDHKGDERATKTMKTTKMTETTQTMMNSSVIILQYIKTSAARCVLSRTLPSAG